MTIEALKSETKKLSKLEKLEFLQFLAGLLSDEERSNVLTPEQQNTLLSRREDVISGNIKMIPAEEVKAKLMKKYGLPS